jgi:hypothetical protein
MFPRVFEGFAGVAKAHQRHSTVTEGIQYTLAYVKDIERSRSYLHYVND